MGAIVLLACGWTGGLATAQRPAATAASNAAPSAAQNEKANQAKQFMQQGRFGEAAALYGELTKAFPGNPGLQMNLGMALHMAGQDAQAIGPLSAALRANPGLPPALLFLGASYLRTGQPSKAMAPLERFVQLDPNHVEARLMLVDAATSSNQAAKALPHLERLSVLDASKPGVWYELGRAYEQFAFDAFAQLERAHPESGPLFALLAESRNKSSQRRAAFFFYRKALAKAPALRGLRLAVAEIYREQGQAEWAAQEEAAEAKLGKPNCAVKTAECEFMAGRFASALQLAKGRIGSAAKPSAEALYWQIRSANALAQQAFAKLSALPVSVEYFRLQAETLRDQNRHQEAAEAWREALRIQPGHPDFTRELAAALLAAKQFAEAQQVTQQLLAAEPEAADVNHLQGDLYLAQQMDEQAIPYLQKAVKAAPELLPAQASLARALLQAGKAAEAVGPAKACLPLDSDGSLHFQYARALQAAGQGEEAKAAMARYQEMKSKMSAQEQQLEEEMKITAPAGAARP